MKIADFSLRIVLALVLVCSVNGAVTEDAFANPVSSPEPSSQGTASDGGEPSDPTTPPETDNGTENSADDTVVDENKDKPSEETDDTGEKDTEGETAAKPDESVPAALPDETAETQSVALSIGDRFLDNNDEGMAVLYSVTSDTTVQVGAGSRGSFTVVNTPTGGAGAYSSSVDSSTGEKLYNYTTISTNYSGVLTIPSTVEFGGNVYQVNAVGAYAFGYIPVMNGFIPFSVSQVLLPSSVGAIGAGAFERAGLSRGLSFPAGSSVTSIGNDAFSGCGMNTFEMPASVTTIGTGIFSGYSIQNSWVRTSLTTLTFAGGGSIASIPDNAFRYCNITAIEIPATVTRIGVNAFMQSYLSTVTIPATVSSLSEGVFAECSRLSSFTIADGSPLKKIPAMTFNKCTALTSFTFPPFIDGVESRAFEGSGLTSVFIPKTLTYLGNASFRNCVSLSSFVFEAGHQLMYIYGDVFFGCTKLAAIDLPDNIRGIKERAFSGCSSLRYIGIPPLCQEFGMHAFQDCISLRTVQFEGNAASLKTDTSVFFNSPNINSVVYLSKKSRDFTTYNAMPRTYYTISYYDSREKMTAGQVSHRFIIAANEIPENVDISQVYSGSLQEPPENMRWAVEEGFSLSGQITDSFSVWAEPKVEDLSEGDTFTAKTMEGVPVTYTVLSTPEQGKPGTIMAGTDFLGTATAIAPNTLGAVTLTSHVIAPDAHTYELTGIAPYAFYNCNRFIEITIPSSVVDIGASAFYRCTALRNVYFESNASSIVDRGIFTACTNISLVIFGGKKANISFGSSSPSVYYTVCYYDSKRDLEINNVQARLLVKERARLGSLNDSDVISGTIPWLFTGYEWAYEPGFSGTAPLTDSCYVFAQGIGFQFQITVLNGNVGKTPCWFRIISLDEKTKTGTVEVGLNKDGITAVLPAVSGVPVIPASVTDGDGNTYAVVGVSNYAFGSDSYWQACIYLTSVNLPAGVTSIGKSAFRSCTALRNITLPRQLTTMGESVFRSCTALSDVSLLNAPNLTAVPAYAFEGDGMLSEVAIPRSTATIEPYAFANCHTVIGNQEFGLTRIDFSSATSLATIGVSAFSGNRLLSGSLVFPDNLGTIGERAFYNTDRVSELSFPGSLTFVGASAFYQNASVGTIAFRGDANRVAFGPGAFNFYKNINAVGSLARINFYGKKSSTVTQYITTGDPTSRGQSDYGRTYRLYYTVKYYASRSSYLAGTLLRSGLVLEDDRPRATAPILTASRSWLCEDGFSVDARATDSFWAYAGYSIAYAQASGVPSPVYYTGDYIKPIPTLTLGGRVLIQGVDYVFDTSYGFGNDGYTNNRRMGRAGIHLKGIGDYTGTLAIYFEIVGQYNIDTTFKVELTNYTFTYDGGPHEPGVKATATVKGAPYPVEKGTDYSVSYSHNTEAGTGYVVVTGFGIFASTKVEEFRILPMNIKGCSLDEYSGEYDKKGVLHISAKLTNNRHRTNPGISLVEGRDFVLSYRSSGLGFVTLFIKGIGNYSGAYSLSLTVNGPPSGDPYGEGEGTGRGGGYGDGSGSGPGNSPGTGSGGSGSNDTSNMGSGNFGTTEAFGGASGSPGSEGGSPYSIYELHGDGPPIEIKNVYYPILAVLQFLLPVVALGIFYGYRRWWYKDSELNYYDPPEPPPAVSVQMQ